MSKLIFTIIISIALPLSSFCQKLELEDSEDNNVLIINPSGNRTSLKYDKIVLTCSNKIGNRSYLNNTNEIVYRSSSKATHISVYNFPKNEQLVRVGLKGDRFTISIGNQLCYTLRTASSGAKLYDANGKVIGEASYNSLSKNTKIVSATQKAIFNYKWPSENYAAILWLADKIPPQIRLIIINELLS